MLRGKDFSYQNLTNHDLSHQDLVEANFRHANCSGVKFNHSNLFRADLTHARLTGCTLSMECGNFQGVKYDDAHVDYLLYLITLTDTDKTKRQEIVDILGIKKIQKFNLLFGQSS